MIDPIEFARPKPDYTVEGYATVGHTVYEYYWFGGKLKENGGGTTTDCSPGGLLLWISVNPTLWTPWSAPTVNPPNAAAATANVTVKTPAPKVIPDRCQYARLAVRSVFQSSAFSSRNVDTARLQAVEEAKLTARRTLREWPACHQGGAVDMTLDGDSIGFKCNKCNEDYTYTWKLNF